MRSVVLQPRTHTTASPTSEGQQVGKGGAPGARGGEGDIGMAERNVLHSTVGGKRCHGPALAKDDPE